MPKRDTINRLLALGLVAASGVAFQLGLGPEVKAQNRDYVQPLRRVCGKLEFVERQREKDSSGAVKENTHALRGVELALLDRIEDSKCCSRANAVANAKSGLFGNFSFKNVRPGSYWLVARTGGREYSMPIQYVADKESETLCSGQVFQIDASGNFGTAMTVVVN